jgi:putative nucleotidyltransferase with HDIG domain
MSYTTAKMMVDGLPALSSLPAVIDELERALEDSSASMDDLGEIVKKDPDLTARLLRLANSSFYGFPKGVETVGEALSLIGIEQMKQLLTGSSVVEYFKSIPSDRVNMRSFWEHSIGTGIAAKVIAVLRRAPDPELYFVSGLIHDIGRLVFYLREPEMAATMLKAYTQNTQKPLYEYEIDTFGFDHGEVAGELLKQWDFPNSLIQAVKYHHHPKRADVYFADAALVNIADFVVHGLGIGNSGEVLVPAYLKEAMQRLDLPENALRSIVRETDKQFEDVVSLFMTGN